MPWLGTAPAHPAASTLRVTRHTPHAQRKNSVSSRLCLRSHVTCHMSLSLTCPFAFFHCTAPHPPPLDEGLFFDSGTNRARACRSEWSPNPRATSSMESGGAVAANVCARCSSPRACGGLLEGNRAGSLAEKDACAGVRIIHARVYAGKDVSVTPRGGLQAVAAASASLNDSLNQNFRQIPQNTHVFPP